MSITKTREVFSLPNVHYARNGEIFSKRIVSGRDNIDVAQGESAGVTLLFVLKNARKQGGFALLSGRCFIGKGAVRAARGCRCKGQTTSSSCAERGTDLCRGCLWRVAPRCRHDADSHTIRDNPCRAGGHRSTR